MGGNNAKQVETKLKTEFAEQDEKLRCLKL